MKKTSKVLITMLTLAVCLSGILPLCVSAVEDTYIYPNVEYKPTDESITTESYSVIAVHNVRGIVVSATGGGHAYPGAITTGDAIYNFRSTYNDSIFVQGTKSSHFDIIGMNVYSTETKIFNLFTPDGIGDTRFSDSTAIYITTSEYERTYQINGEVIPMIVQSVFTVYNSDEIYRDDIAVDPNSGVTWYINSIVDDIQIRFLSDYTTNYPLDSVQFTQRFTPGNLVASDYANRYILGYTDIISKLVDNLPEIISVNNPIIVIVLIISGATLILVMLKFIKNTFRR